MELDKTKIKTHFTTSDSNINIKSIYELGRENIDPEKQTGLFDRVKLKSNNTDSVHQGVLSTITEILKLVSQKQFGFSTGFFELSLFDPKDISAEQFYTILVGGNTNQISCYYEQMGCNIDMDITLLPNSIFYDSPFYYLRQETNKKFNPLFTDKGCQLKAEILGFDTNADINFSGSKNREEKEKIEDNVFQFFQRIVNPKKVKDTKDMEPVFNDNGLHNLNTFIIIPLYRPAAKIKSETTTNLIHRGGALMLYGNSDEEFNHTQFILNIQNVLIKQIFKISHSELNLITAQNEMELGIYHHLGTTVGGLADFLQLEYINYDNSLSDWQKRKISIVRNSFKSLSNNTALALKTYRSFLIGGKRTNSALFNELDNVFIELNEVYENFEVKLEFKNIVVSKVTLNPLPNEFFFLIAVHFINNSISAFNNKEEPLKIHITIQKKNDCAFFIFKNNGPILSAKRLETLGIIPQGNTTSSGLGYYFLNNSLKLLGAVKTQKRYFEIKNMTPDWGVELKLTFKL